jgi:hypothetical protein
MKWIKVIFGGLCFFAVLFSALSGVWTAVGEFIEDGEIRAIVSFLIILIIGWGYERFEKDWRHYN